MLNCHAELVEVLFQHLIMVYKNKRQLVTERSRSAAAFFIVIKMFTYSAIPAISISKTKLVFGGIKGALPASP